MRTHAWTAGAVATCAVVVAAVAAAQMQHRDASPSAEPRRVTMEELHRSGGVPRGWRFTLPPGDPTRGKQVFVDAGCYKCHTVTGAGFPDAAAEKKPGPDLTGMGSHHPAEYFAESIVAPNAVILLGPGYTGPDGLSIMPSYVDALSVRELLDVVAFVRSLGAEGHEGHEGHDPHDQRTTAGDYAVRLVYVPPGADHGHAGHQHGASMPGPSAGKSPGTKRGHVLVFVADKETGEAVPYLPVSLTVKGQGVKPRMLRLNPMLGGEGFHYGADVTIPDEAEELSVSIGRTTMTVMNAARGRFTRPVTARFDW